MIPPARSPFTADLVRGGVPWLRGGGACADVVVSSRVRLARNIAGFPFLTRASRAQRQAVLDAVRERVRAAGLMPPPAAVAWIDIHTAPPAERTFLLERHLISKEHAKGDSPRALVVTLPDESLSIMVNEEDQLRVQVLRPAFDLRGALRRAFEADDHLGGVSGAGAAAHALADGLNWAWSERFGFLTACPTNVGTGLRVSVMMHLPALKLTSEMDRVRRAARDMSLAVRGYYGEGSEAAGDLHQISNQVTLGRSEQEILEEFERAIVPRVIEYERKARDYLLQRKRRLLEDTVFRALGVLQNARLLTPEDAVTHLSSVRLGIACGLVAGLTYETVEQVIVLVQPAHLQRLVGVSLDQNARREARADLVRERLKPAAAK